MNWNKIEDQVKAGTFPKVFINRDGNLCLADSGNGAVLPRRLAAQFPAEIVANAQAVAKAAAQSAAAKFTAKLAEAEARRIAFEDKLAPFAGVKNWHLAGFCVDELSSDTYTLVDLRRVWDWAGPVVCEHVAQGESISAVFVGERETIHVVLGTSFRSDANQRSKRWSFVKICEFLASELAMLKARK